MENFTVLAYDYIDGKKTLVAWATGLNKKGAKAIFQIYYDEGRAEIIMNPTKIGQEIA